MAKLKKYRVLADGVESDQTGKRFEKGETVTSKDFKQSVILNWLEIGALEEITDGEG